MITSRLQFKLLGSTPVLQFPAGVVVRRFTPNVVLPREDLEASQRYAEGMTGGKGEHRNRRSGGTATRTPALVYENAYLGKLAEFAVWRTCGGSAPCCDLWELGQYECLDSVIAEKRVAIKASKSISRLCLLEKEDWETGLYLGTQEIDELHFCRIDVSGGDPLIEYSGKVDSDLIQSIIWEQTMSDSYLHKNDCMWSLRTPLDADNYYICVNDFV